MWPDEDMLPSSLCLLLLATAEACPSPFELAVAAAKSHTDLEADLVVLAASRVHQHDALLEQWLGSAKRLFNAPTMISTVDLVEERTIDSWRSLVLAVDVPIPNQLSHRARWLTPMELVEKSAFRLDSAVFPYVCAANVTQLWEHYAIIGSGKIKSNLLATLNEMDDGGGLLWTADRDKWNRRQDLEGAQLVNTFLEFDRFLRTRGQRGKDPAGGRPIGHRTSDFEGLSVDIVKYLEEVMNFTTLWVGCTRLSLGRRVVHHL